MTFNPLTSRVNLTGRWIGETQGAKTEAHHWVIKQQGRTLTFYTKWEKERHLKPLYIALMDEEGWTFYYKQINLRARLIDADHFVISKWVGYTINGEFTPYHDVAFQRRDEGIKRVYYWILINMMVSLKTGLWLYGLGRFIGDPMRFIG